MTGTMTWQQVLERCTAEVRARVQLEVDRYLAGDTSRDELVLSLVVLLNVSSAQGAAVADEYTAMQLGTLPLGITAEFNADSDEDMAADLHDALDDSRGPSEALRALSGIAVLGAMHAARHEALGGHGVTMWRRVPEPDACAVCEAMAAEGPLPMSVEPYHHPGCSCAQDIVTDERN